MIKRFICTVFIFFFFAANLPISLYANNTCNSLDLTASQKIQLMRAFDKSLNKRKSYQGHAITKETKTKIKNAFYNIVHNRSFLSDLECILETTGIIKDCLDTIKQNIGTPEETTNCDTLTCEDINTLFQYLVCACENLIKAESKVCLIENKVDALDRCNCMPIFQSDLSGVFPSTTITQSGCYCLAEDIAGEIEIGVNDVSLDLNNHTISNIDDDCIEMQININNFSVYNGTIAPNSGHGIHLRRGNDFICIHNVRFTITGSDSHGIFTSTISGDTVIDKINIDQSIFCGDDTSVDQFGITFSHPSAFDFSLTNLVIQESTFSNLYDGVSFATIGGNPYIANDLTIYDCLFHTLDGNGISFNDTMPMLNKPIAKNKTVNTPERTINNVTLQNTTFQNITGVSADSNNSGNGLAVYSAAGDFLLDNLVVKNCIFSDISGSDQPNGGNGIAVYTNLDDTCISNLSILHTTFNNCISPQTDPQNAGNGIAILANVNNEEILLNHYTIKDCIFTSFSGVGEAPSTNMANGIAIFGQNSGSGGNPSIQIRDISISNNSFSNTATMTNPIGKNVANGVAITTTVNDQNSDTASGSISNITFDNCSFSDISGQNIESSGITHSQTAANGISLLETTKNGGTIENINITDCTFNNITANADRNAGNGVFAHTSANGSTANISTILVAQCSFNNMLRNQQSSPGSRVGNGVCFHCNTEVSDDLAVLQDIAIINSTFNQLEGMQGGSFSAGTSIALNCSNIEDDALLQKILIDNCTINSSERGINIESIAIQSISINNTTCSNVLERGITISQDLEATNSCVQIIDCHIVGPTTTPSDPTEAINIVNMGNVIVRNSSVHCCSSTEGSQDFGGFSILNCLNILIADCVAKGNQNGFVIDGELTKGIVRNCTAEGNTNFGFSYDDGGMTQDVLFYHNTSCHNGDNYSGISAVTISPPSTAEPFDNVDCDLLPSE